MIGLGTIINVLAIIGGSAIGMAAQKGIPEHLQKSVMKVLGISTMFIGLSGTLAEMLVITEEGISTRGIMLMIVSLVIGTFVGELIRIEDRLEALGDKMKNLKLFRSASATFTEGFVTATLVVSIGAMAIIGSFNDGLGLGPEVLITKSILDFVSTMIFASTLGVGVLCSCVPMGIYQGLLTVLAQFLKPLFDGTNIVSDLSLVGSVLIFAIGINLFASKSVKVGNMLPALLIPVVYGLTMKWIA
ncbi:MAG: DUF554 domain-containing protein [Ruminococcaceae bacterium]|nr:DUF554 domain-containing protein [Oscillospiraceae bacterium]